MDWLDRLTANGEHLSRRLADVALVQAAIEAYETDLAVEQAQFYASAVRGRPQVRSETGREVEAALSRTFLRDESPTASDLSGIALRWTVRALTPMWIPLGRSSVGSRLSDSASCGLGRAWLELSHRGGRRFASRRAR